MVKAEDIQNCLNKLPDVSELFRNQQKYLHLFLLYKGFEVTAEKLKDLLSPFRPGFSQATYYSVRKWLISSGFSCDGSERSSGARGPVEISHRIVDDRERQLEFENELKRTGLVTRPVSIGKHSLLQLLLLAGEVSRHLSAHRRTRDGREMRKVISQAIWLLSAYHDQVFLPARLVQGFIDLSIDLYRAAGTAGVFKGFMTGFPAWSEPDGDRTAQQIELAKAAMPEAMRFFKYQQRYLHLFMFADGEEITSDKVARVCAILGRTFSRNTYAQTKKWLFSNGFARDGKAESANVRGRKELSHRLVDRPAKSAELRDKLMEAVNRPARISKYLLLELATRRPHALEDLQEIRKLLADSWGTFVPAILALRTVCRAFALARARFWEPIAVSAADTQAVMTEAYQSDIRPVEFTGSLLSLLSRPGPSGNDALEIAECRGLERIEARGSEASSVSVRQTLSVEDMVCRITINVGLVNGAYNLSIEPGQNCTINPPLNAHCRLLKKRDGGMEELTPSSHGWQNLQSLDKLRELRFDKDENLVVSIAFIRLVGDTRVFYGELRIEIDHDGVRRGA